MNINQNNLLSAPPKLTGTLLRGLNAVANHIHLIILPVLVDLLLWLGPKLRVKDLFMPIVNDFTTNMLKFSPPELLETVKTSNTIWDALLNHYNLLTAIRTFPVGIPSLVARQSPIASPINAAWTFEIPSIQVGAAVLGALLILGFFLGTVYFNALSRATATEVEKADTKKLLTQYVQSVLLFCLLVAILLVISIPCFMLLSVFSLISPGLGQFFLLMVAFVMVWLIMPLVFAPHGVFVLNQKAFPSMLLSLRLVRVFLPTTGLFIMTSILISEGFNLLWTLPDANSWLTLLGIFGHAFIVTGLLAASFLYYRDGLRWMQFNIQRMSTTDEKSTIGELPHD